MDKMRMKSVDITAQNIEKIGEMFPNCITETVDENGKPKKAINFELLRQMLSGDVLDGDEAYEFTWVGKKAAIVEANKPIRKTLRPCKEESKNFDTTENLYIEGDNLDVLKLLQESYLNKVKMIYIDPPYNTGNDSFIYPDNYAMNTDEYEDGIGLYDDDDNKLFAENNDTNPRFHSDWCSMLYSRLILARNLIADDGLIFVSIDDCEIDNLLKVSKETFGSDNLIATLIWDLGTGTTAGHFTRGHEYIVCFAKNKSAVSNFKNYNDGERIAHGALKKISYKNPAVEITFPIGFEFEGNNAVFSGELGASEKEYILSDEMRFENGKLVAPVKMKAGFSMRNQVEDYIAGKEVFDSKGQKLIRFYFNSKGILFYEKEKSVINPRTVLSSIANTKNGSSELSSLFENKYFDFPKPTALLKYLIQLVTNKDSIVVDFFSGSSTTAHAVMQLNAEDGGNRKFIMVQLPEVCAEDSEAYKAGYKNICDIGKERIRRAGEKIKAEIETANQQLKLDEEEKKVPDIGFRVLKLDESNMTDIYYSADEYNQDMLNLLESNVKADRSDSDLLFSCLLEWGLPLSESYYNEMIENCTVHTYGTTMEEAKSIIDEIKSSDSSTDKIPLIACFDENIPESVVKVIAKRQPIRAVFRDRSFANSPDKINVTEIFKLLSPDTRVKVL